MQGKGLAQWTKKHELTPIGKSDKPPSDMFVTNHFNKKKENTISNQALCNIKSHSRENSIIQT